jgi:hypothetical protein
VTVRTKTGTNDAKDETQYEHRTRDPTLSLAVSESSSSNDDLFMDPSRPLEGQQDLVNGEHVLSYPCNLLFTFLNQLCLFLRNCLRSSHILDVNGKASVEQIRSAFKKLACLDLLSD